MSKYIKGLFNKPGQGSKNNEETSPQPQNPQPIQKASNDPFEKPFSIDLNDLWKYDVEELSEYINKYEKFTADLKKYCLNAQKEVNMVKERLEISEQERKSLGMSLIETLEKLKKEEDASEKKSQNTKVSAQIHEGGKTQVNLELVLRQHINYENMISLSERQELQNLSEIAVDQLESVIQNLNKLQNVSWDTLGEQYQASIVDDAEEEDSISTGIYNTAVAADRTLESGESERNFSLETERQKKKWPNNLVKSTNSQMKVFKTNLWMQFNIDVEKSFLLEEKLRTEMASILKQTEAEINKISTHIIKLVAKLEAFDSQSIKALVSELENIFPAGTSGGADLQKYSQQLEQHIQQIKVKYQELEAKKVEEVQEYRNQLKETKKSLETQLSMSNEKLAEELRKNEQLMIQLQDAQLGSARAQESIGSFKRDNLEQALKYESLFKQLIDEKAQEENLLSTQKALEEQLGSTLTKFRTSTEGFEKKLQELEQPRSVKEIDNEKEADSEAVDQKAYLQTQAELAKSLEEINNLRAEITRLKELNQQLELARSDQASNLNQEQLKGDIPKINIEKVEETLDSNDSKKGKQNTLKQFFESLDSKNKEKRNSLQLRTSPSSQEQLKTSPRGQDPPSFENNAKPAGLNNDATSKEMLAENQSQSIAEQRKEVANNFSLPDSILRLEKSINNTIFSVDQYLQNTSHSKLRLPRKHLENSALATKLSQK